MNQIAEARYQYSALRPGEIRILQLHSKLNDVGSHDLWCSLSPAMPASTTYAALSYAWGSPEKVSQILVKDIDARPNGWIPLTLNLDNALHDLLASDLQPKTLWIDQICINQDDNAEKGLQVAMFGQIYRMASRVVTYLGPAKRNVDAAVSLLDRIFSHFSPKLEELHVPYHEGIIQLFRIGGQEFMFDEDTPGWDVVLDRALSPWLSRVWMVQENLLNRNTQVLFGPRLLDQHKFLMIPILIHEDLLPGALALDPARSLPLTNLVFSAMRMLAISKQSSSDQAQQRGFPELRELLVGFGKSECSDPRDSVFALLGVASDTETLGIQANYDASEQDILIDTTMRIINVKDNLQVLSENRYPVRERRKDLPSWVPDWKDKDKVDAYGFIGSGKASSGMPASGRFEQGNRVLVLDGLIVARLNKPIAAKPITLRSMYRQLLRGDQVPEIEDLNQMLVKLEEALGRDRDDLNYRLGCLLLTVRQLPEEFSGITKFEGVGAGFCAAMKLLNYTNRQFKVSVDEPSSLTMASEISGDERALAIKFINMDFLCASLYWECGNNQVCVAPVETEEGDVAAILAGGDYMYILRPVPGKDSYLYVGEAWIHDFMEGEACHELDWQQRSTILKIE